MRWTSIVVLVWVVALWPLVALASSAPPAPDTDAAEWIKALYAAFASGEWKIAGGLIALAIVYVARRWGPDVFKGRKAGYALAIIVSLLGTLGTAAASGAAITAATVLSAIATAITASGLWELVKDVRAKPSS